MSTLVDRLSAYAAELRFEALPAGARLPLRKRIAVHVGKPLCFDKVANNREGWEATTARLEEGVRAARRALEKAAIGPDEVDHVNAHATSTPEGDKAELQAIKTILGDRAATVPVTANKSMIGHTLGAAGAIEAITTVMSIRESCIPPTLNLDQPDPEGEGMTLVTRAAMTQDTRVALSNSFGFGGQNTALLFRRWDA